MRKLLILMLVLGLASSANAVIISFKTGGSGGTVGVFLGSTVTVDVVADTACTSSYSFSITETTTSSAGHSTATGPGAYHVDFNYQVQPGNLRNMNTNFGGAPRYMLIDRAAAGMSPAGNIPAGQVLFQFEVLIPASGGIGDTWTIDAAVGMPVVSPPPAPYSHQFDGLSVAGTNELTLQEIPEPATIALLGLGSLFLMRRRRK